MKVNLLLGVTLLTTTCQSIAHEYWLDPIDVSVAVGESVIVDVRNGQNFNGIAFPFDSGNFKSITISSRTSTESYSGRLGDYPAIHPEINSSGLHSINLATTAKLLTYESLDKFNNFLDFHALDEIKARHLERKLPTTNIQERYFRSAKTMIQASDSGILNLEAIPGTSIENHNAFVPVGDLFEMVLLNNPYSDTDSIRIKLFFDSQPLAGRQIEMFWKGSTQLRYTTVTDSAGIASFKLLGDGDYLLNAVQVIEPDDKNVHWLSYWASVTFER